MLGRWINAETVSNTSIISYEVIIANILHRKFCAQEGKATIGHPFPHQLDIKIQITYNHTIHVSIQPNQMSSEGNTLSNLQVLVPIL